MSDAERIICYVNMEKVGRKIVQLRISHNMTQLELADKMGISFHAVSNWERGNSMPDTAKLPELAKLFGVTIDSILGEHAQAVTTIIEGDINQSNISPEELDTIAPVLKPSQIENIFENVNIDNLSKMDSLLPFASQKTICWHVNLLYQESKFTLMEDVLPFLRQEALHALAQKACEEEKVDALESIAPFAEQEVIDKIVTTLYQKKENFESIEDLMSFMHPEAVDALAMHAVQSGNFQDLDIIAPFMRQATIHHIVRWMTRQHIDTEDIASFASETIYEKKHRNTSGSHTLNDLPQNIDRGAPQSLIEHVKQAAALLKPKK